MQINFIRLISTTYVFLCSGPIIVSYNHGQSVLKVNILVLFWQYLLVILFYGINYRAGVDLFHIYFPSNKITHVHIKNVSLFFLVL